MGTTLFYAVIVAVILTVGLGFVILDCLAQTFRLSKGVTKRAPGRKKER